MCRHAQTLEKSFRGVLPRSSWQHSASVSTKSVNHDTSRVLPSFPLTSVGTDETEALRKRTLVNEHVCPRALVTCCRTDYLEGFFPKRVDGADLDLVYP